MTDLAALKRDLSAVLAGVHIRGHYRANAIPGTRRYALFVNGTQHGDPLPHAAVLERQRELQVEQILATLASHGVELCAAEPVPA